MSVALLANPAVCRKCKHHGSDVKIADVWACECQCHELFKLYNERDDVRCAAWHFPGGTPMPHPPKDGYK